MKKYFAPEMTTLLFNTVEMIAADEAIPEDASNLFNDSEFGKW